MRNFIWQKAILLNYLMHSPYYKFVFYVSLQRRKEGRVENSQLYKLIVGFNLGLHWNSTIFTVVQFV